MRNRKLLTPDEARAILQSPPQEHQGISRRAFLGLATGVAGATVGSGLLRGAVYRWARWREDLFPGRPPVDALEAHAWTTTDDNLTFAVLGDNGSGGRNAMDVARQMHATYRRTPYGLVLLAGDISYYGPIQQRFEDVFVKPYWPLVEAGVKFELAIGNHELEEERSPEAAREIEDQVRQFGKPGTYYQATYGPVDFFMLDSSTPLVVGEKGPEQVVWLEEALRTSEARWKVVTLHHPLYSSGRHGSQLRVREAIEELLIDSGVDIVFTGHDHHYERTLPQGGIVYVVSGGGCKLTPVGRSGFTAFSKSVLQFMLVRVSEDSMDLRCIDKEGRTVDHFEIRRRSS